MASTCGTVLMVLQGRFTKLLSLVVQELPSRLKYHSLGLSNLRTGNPRAGSLGIGNLRMGHLRVDNLGIDNPRAGLLGAGNPDIVNLRASSLVMDNLKIDNPPKKFKLVLKSKNLENLNYVPLCLIQSHASLLCIAPCSSPCR